MEAQFTNLKGINTYVSPTAVEDGNIIHAVNLEGSPIGGLTKRTGYSTYLGTPDNGTVNTLFTWVKNDGTTFFNYRASGSSLYYSIQGTGDWTLATNGTIANGGHVGHAVLDNTLIIGDGVGSTRHTTDGITFTDTTLAPISEFLAEFQGRIYAAGTASDLFYSAAGTPTDWSLASDSSSLFIGGGGKLSPIFKASDRLMITKNSQTIRRWDGQSLVDMATRLGPSSPYSIGEVEDFRFWLNRLGIFASNSGKPELISNAIQNQIYNDDGTGIAGSLFDTTAGGVHRYNYYLSQGTITDNLVGEQIPNSILVFDYKNNDFFNYRLNNFPYAYHSYKDTNGDQQFIFGDASGQCYTLGSGNSDNGVPIETNMQMVVHGGMPHIKKNFQYLEAITNPGCEAKIQVAVTDTFMVSGKKWVELGNLTSGFNQFRLPTEVARGNFLFIRVYESSLTKPFTLYSINVTFEPVAR